MLIDTAIESLQGLISFFTKYREIGFAKALEAAKEIAMEMDIIPGFHTKCKITRKRQFDKGRLMHRPNHILQRSHIGSIIIVYC
jgi:hypothetical protein